MDFRAWKDWCSSQPFFHGLPGVLLRDGGPLRKSFFDLRISFPWLTDLAME